MSDNFLRKYRLTILGVDGKKTVIEHQQVTFNVALKSDSKLNELDINIFNLSAETISNFAKIDSTVTLEVGYGDNPLGTIFQGNKIFCATRREGTELITNLLATDGAVIVREGRVQIAVPEKSSVEYIIREIIKKGMKEISVVNIQDVPEVKKTYSRGYSASGGAKEQLDSICNANNLKWHIVQGRTINVFPVTGDIQRTAVVITPDMIKNTPEQTSQELRKLKDDLSVPRKLGLNLTLQMNFYIAAGALIQLKGTFNADGNYVVDHITHNGDYEGDSWDSKLECTSYV
jgi:hypothetical protein